MACTSDADCTNPGFPDCEQRNPGAYSFATARTVSVTGVAAGSLGAGFRWIFSPKLALRVDARGYALFEVESVAIACGAGCAAGFGAGGTTQGELTLALSVGF